MAAPVMQWDESLKDVFDSLSKSGETSIFKKSLTGLERIYFLRNRIDLNKVDWLKQYFENQPACDKKSSEKAALERLAGNKLFQKKQFRGSLEKYTEAILQGPVKVQELALAFGNRSAAWFHLEEYKNCLEDISQANKNGYPVTTQYKLDLRQAHCHFRLENWTDCSEALEKFFLHIEMDQALSEKRKDELKKEARDLRSKISEARSASKVFEKEDSPVPIINYGPSLVLVQASGAVDLMCNEKQGRFLIANRDIKAGDTLIVERPYAAVLLPDHYTSHCHHCFMVLQAVYPCRQCTSVKYCSPLCEEEAWISYHYVECSHLDLLHSVGIAHLSFRIILVAGLQFLLDFRKNLEESRTGDKQIPGLTESGKYERNYLSVYDLMTHTEDMATEDLLKYSITALLLLKILKHSNWFGKHNVKTHNLNEKEKTSKSGNKTEPTTENTCIKEGAPNIGTDEGHESSKCFDKCDNIVNSMSDLHICNGFEPISHESGNISMPKDISSGDNHKEYKVKCDSKCSKCGLEFQNQTSAEARKHLNMLNSDDTELYIGSLLLRHIQQLICNAHAITEIQVTQSRENTPVQETSQVRVATAIYPTASLMNHSCDPTIISSFYKDNLIVRAVKDVKAGGEIFNCYGPHFRRMKRAERQQCLNEQYFFRCSCQPCISGADEEEMFSSFGCPMCSGPFCRTANRLVCRECQYTSSSLHEIVAQTETASNLFSDGVLCLHQENYKDAISVVTSCYKMRKKILYKHNRQLAETQDCLAQCYAMTGQFKKASKFLQESIRTVRVIHGSESIEVANELRKLSEVLISAQEWKSALKVTKEAIVLFELHYGKSHDSVRELRAAEAELKDLLRVS